MKMKAQRMGEQFLVNQWDTTSRYKWRSIRLIYHEICTCYWRKGPGQIVTNYLKCVKQCSATNRKANIIMGLITRSFDHKTPQLITPLYTVFVRPQLEYAAQFWSPCFQKDITKLESMQRQTNKMYLKNVMIVSWWTFNKITYVLIRGELIETFIIIENIDNIDYKNLLELSQPLTRNKGLKRKEQWFGISYQHLLHTLKR